MSTRDYRHHALLYGSADDLLSSAEPFLRAGAEEGDVVVLACRDDVTEAVRSALPGAAVVSLDRDALYVRSAAAITRCSDEVRRHLAAGAPRVRMLGEVDYGRHPRAWAEWGRYEAVCNAVLSGLPLWHVCAYATAGLPDAVRDNIVRTHPLWLAEDGPVSNDRFVPPDDYLAEPDDDLWRAMESTPPASQTVLSRATGLSGLREHFTAALHRLTVSRELAEEFVAAVSEVAGNGLMHGRPPVLARLWVDAHSLMCAVTDHGPGIDDHLIGFTPPDHDARSGGRGLWLVRHLCDGLALHRDDGGFTVRLHSARNRPGSRPQG